MGVSLERVQNKFACIIGELCSEPLILSQFAVWVDLRIAEYKTKGTISLDCSGDSPNPQWMKGVKNDPPRAGPTSLDTGQGSNHRRGSYAPSSAESTLYNDRVQPPELSPRHSQNSNSQHSFSTRLSPDVMVIKSEPGADQETSCTLSRKRLSQGSDLQSDYYSPSKSRRLGNAPSTLSSAAQQESSSNQSLMSIINAENDNIVLESVDTSNADIFRSTVNASQNELDATPAFSSNTAYSPRQSAATSSGSSPSQSAWPTQYSSSQSAQGSSSQTEHWCGTNPESGVGVAENQYQDATWSSIGLPTSKKHSRKGKKVLNVYEKRKSLTSIGIFDNWLMANNKSNQKGCIQEIPPDALDGYLAEFYRVIKKTNGKDYTFKSFESLRDGIKMYLLATNYGHCIATSSAFRKSQSAYLLRRKQLMASQASATTGSLSEENVINETFGVVT